MQVFRAPSKEIRRGAPTAMLNHLRAALRLGPGEDTKVLQLDGKP